MRQLLWLTMMSFLACTGIGVCVRVCICMYACVCVCVRVYHACHQLHLGAFLSINVNTTWFGMMILKLYSSFAELKRSSGTNWNPGTHEAYRKACLERARFLERKLVSSICWGPKESTWITYIMTFQKVLVLNVANHYTVTQSLLDFTTNYQPGVDRIWYDFNFQIHGLLLGINFIFYLLQDGCTSCLSFIKLTHYMPHSYL